MLRIVFAVIAVALAVIIPLSGAGLTTPPAKSTKLAASTPAAVRLAPSQTSTANRFAPTSRTALLPSETANSRSQTQDPDANVPRLLLTGTPAAVRTAPAATTGAVPLVEIAETVQVRFQGYSDISGTYRINEDQTISIPGIGRFIVTTATASQLEQMLSKRIVALTGRESAVSVEVDRYREVFVTGDVENPGAFKWFRGMTVLKAVSIAGGLLRPKSDRSDASSNSSVALVSLRLAQELSRHARLSAQLRGQNTIEVPERLVGLVGLHQARLMIATEQRLLGTRALSQSASIKAIEASITATETELLRLGELKTSLESRHQKLSGIVDKLKGAFGRRVITGQRMLEAETTLALLDEKRASTTVQLASATAQMQKLKRDRIEVSEARTAEIATKLTKSWNMIQRLQVQLDMARRSAPEDQTAGAGQKTIVSTFYEIVRGSGTTQKRMAASELDPLRPGDSLIVRRRRQKVEGETRSASHGLQSYRTEPSRQARRSIAKKPAAAIKRTAKRSQPVTSRRPFASDTARGLPPLPARSPVAARVKKARGNRRG